jgi:hypothetical protein
MRNILKNSTNTIPPRLLSQQQILNLTQRLILKMIPPINITSILYIYIYIGGEGEWGTYELVSPYKNAGALMNCLPFLQRLHLNVSCVSQFVVSLYLNRVRKSRREKCLSTSSAYSRLATPKKGRWYST